MSLASITRMTLTLLGVAMSTDQLAELPTRQRVPADVREPLEPDRALPPARRPRMMRMPADWWDSPSAVCCPLSRGPQSARAARKLTKTTLREWGLAGLADDAEMIVGEFVANALLHAPSGDLVRRASADSLGLRLLRRSGEVICAVLDPSDAAPVLRVPESAAENGRGLLMVDALSDVWGWSPVVGVGKAVWAILFYA